MPSLSKTPINRAAYLVAPKQKPVEIRDAPYTSPKVDEIVIKNRALAINPIDWVKQDMGAMVFSWAKYPCIEGNDVAGEVVEVGPLVTRFKTGDRVVGLALGLSKERNTPTEGAFQLYTVLVERVVSPIPDGMSFEDASVLPLGMFRLLPFPYASLPYSNSHPFYSSFASGLWPLHYSLSIHQFQVF